METGKVAEQQGNFFKLREQTPFSIKELPTTGENIFSSRRWLRGLSLSPETKTKLRLTRDEIHNLLGVNSYSEIQDLIRNPQKREEVRKEAYKLLANTYEIEGTEKEIALKIESYAETADEVINHLKNGPLSHYGPKLEMINEVMAETNPVDLLLIFFDDRYTDRARFEAKRKLILMDLAASIDQREREAKTTEKFAEFLEFLNQHVWSKDEKIGEVKRFNIFSFHDPQNFACLAYEKLTPEQVDKYPPKENEKLTPLDMRTFTTDKGQKIPIYVTTRNKPDVLKILKLLRKGEENPAIAVDDELGLLGVVFTTRQVDQFQKHLGNKAKETGSLMKFEEITDTLGGGRYNGNGGSSPDVRMRKFFIKFGGIRVELVLLTVDSYLDYSFRDDVSHEEYEVKRLIESGVTKLLFPDVDIDEDLSIQQVRRKIRGN